jgi:YD repeat-containing protein
MRTGLPQPLVSASYDAANRIATWAGRSFGCDPNGSLASDGLTSYTWNARNQLTGLSGGASASFAYDGVGRRRERTTSGSTSYLYDGINADSSSRTELGRSNVHCAVSTEILPSTLEDCRGRESWRPDQFYGTRGCRVPATD